MTTGRQKRRRGKALSNAERQALWRANRDAELAALRKATARAEPAKDTPEPDKDDDGQPAHLAVPARRKRARHVTTKPPKPLRSPAALMTREHVSTRINALTRAQIDPEFTGTPLEFVDRHGHVRLQTAEQQATDMFFALASKMRAALAAARKPKR